MMEETLLTQLIAEITAGKSSSEAIHAIAWESLDQSTQKLAAFLGLFSLAPFRRSLVEIDTQTGDSISSTYSHNTDDNLSSECLVSNNDAFIEQAISYPYNFNGGLLSDSSSANIFLINPAGVLFGPNVQLNLPSSFTATTATGTGFGENWFDSSFGLNNYELLTGTPDAFVFGLSEPGAIVNTGTLEIGQNQSLMLLGGTVVNTGTLATAGGEVTITAVPGEEIVRVSNENQLLSLDFETIDMATNPPEIQLSQGFSPLTLPEFLTGGEAATTPDLVEADGTVRLTVTDTVIPDEASIAISAGDLDAFGVNGGGTVRVGGDYQGQGTVPNSIGTYVGSDAVIDASALVSGDGGQVIIWSDGTTAFAGEIISLGGELSGNAGFVEVSGKTDLFFRGDVGLSAANGEGGSLLLDPQNIVIVSGNGAPNDVQIPLDGVIRANDFIETGDPDETFTISEEALEALVDDNQTIYLAAKKDITIRDLADNVLDLVDDSIFEQDYSNLAFEKNLEASSRDGRITFEAGNQFAMDDDNDVIRAWSNLFIIGDTSDSSANSWVINKTRSQTEDLAYQDLVKTSISRGNQSDGPWDDPNPRKDSIWCIAETIDGHTISNDYIVSLESSIAVESIADFNRDACADILWRTSDTREISAWYMGGTNNTQAQGYADLNVISGIHIGPRESADINGLKVQDTTFTTSSGNTILITACSQNDEDSSKVSSSDLRYCFSDGTVWDISSNQRLIRDSKSAPFITASDWGDCTTGWSGKETRLQQNDASLQHDVACEASQEEIYLHTPLVVSHSELAEESLIFTLSNETEGIILEPQMRELRWSPGRGRLNAPNADIQVNGNSATIQIFGGRGEDNSPHFLPVFSTNLELSGLVWISHPVFRNNATSSSSELFPKTLDSRLTQSFTTHGETLIAQMIPDNTLGAEESVITQNVLISGEIADQIEGGATHESSLFHSFQEFNINRGQQVYSTNPVGIETILSRVTGANQSDILGVYGPADLFLINPNGIGFKPNSQLDIAGSFLASTADGFIFPDRGTFSATNPELPPLLTMNVQAGVQYGTARPQPLISDANLTVGQNLVLPGGEVTSSSRLSAGGNLTLEWVTGDVQLQEVAAHTVLLSANGNLLLNGSQLETTGNLTLQAGSTVQIEDSTEQPFIASAGMDLLMQGEQSIDTLDLSDSDGDNSLDSKLFARRDLIFRSPTRQLGNRLDPNNALHAVGSYFRTKQLDDTLIDLWIPYNDANVVRANSDIQFFRNYNDSSLYILAGGQVTTADDVTDINDDDATIMNINVKTPGSVTATFLDGNSSNLQSSQLGTLDIRAGVGLDELTLGTLGSTNLSLVDSSTSAIKSMGKSTSLNIILGDFDDGNEFLGENITNFLGNVASSTQIRPDLLQAATFQDQPPGNIIGDIDTSTTDERAGGPITLESVGNIVTNALVDSESATIFGNSGDDGNIFFSVSNSIIANGDLDSGSLSNLLIENAMDGEAITLLADDDITIDVLNSSYLINSFLGDTGKGGNITLSADNNLLIDSNVNSSSIVAILDNSEARGKINFLTNSDIEVHGASVSPTVSVNGASSDGCAVIFSADGDITVNNDPLKQCSCGVIADSNNISAFSLSGLGDSGLGISELSGLGISLSEAQSTLNPKEEIFGIGKKTLNTYSLLAFSPSNRFLGVDDGECFISPAENEILSITLLPQGQNYSHVEADYGIIDASMGAKQSLLFLGGITQHSNLLDASDRAIWAIGIQNNFDVSYSLSIADTEDVVPYNRDIIRINANQISLEDDERQGIAWGITDKTKAYTKDILAEYEPEVNSSQLLTSHATIQNDLKISASDLSLKSYFEISESPSKPTKIDEDSWTDMIHSLNELSVSHNELASNDPLGNELEDRKEWWNYIEQKERCVNDNVCESGLIRVIVGSRGTGKTTYLSRIARGFQLAPELAQEPPVIEKQLSPETTSYPHNSPPIKSVPPPYFVGRSVELKALAKQLHSTTCVVIAGLGGGGKTELAMAYYYRSFNAFRDRSIVQDCCEDEAPWQTLNQYYSQLYSKKKFNTAFSSSFSKYVNAEINPSLYDVIGRGIVSTYQVAPNKQKYLPLSISSRSAQTDDRLASVRNDFNDLANYQELVNRRLLFDLDDETFYVHEATRPFLREKLNQLPEADDMKRIFNQIMVAVAKRIVVEEENSKMADFSPDIPHIIEAVTTWREWLDDHDAIIICKALEKFYASQKDDERTEIWRLCREKLVSSYKQLSSTSQFSAERWLDRLPLIHKLGSLREAQFMQVILALDPSKVSSLVGFSREQIALALLDWIESPTGSGVHTLQNVLNKILNVEPSSDSAQEFQLPQIYHNVSERRPTLSMKPGLSIAART